MGEFLFSVGYGGSLIVLGLITRFFVRGMEKDIVPEYPVNKNEKVEM